MSLLTDVKSVKQDDAEITHSYDIANAFNTYYNNLAGIVTYFAG